MSDQSDLLRSYLDYCWTRNVKPDARRILAAAIDDAAEVHERLRVLDASRKRACSCGGPETCAIPDDCQRR